jgi:Fe-S oxidoreductase
LRHNSANIFIFLKDVNLNQIKKKYVIMRTIGFKKEQCDFCGLCFHLCPVLKLSLDEARKEIAYLVGGGESKYVLSKCNTCFSCNLYCPNQANPYQLILERWNDLYKRRGAPPLYGFVCPTEESNIWQLLNIFLSNKEKKWIFDWMSYIPKVGEEVLLIGNYTHLFPFIIGGSKLLEHIKPIDRIDQWEGGAYLYQGGYLDVVQKIAARTKFDFDQWNVRNVVATLDAVEYIFNEVHPKEMGVVHKQKFINFNKWFLNKLESDEFKLSKKLDLTVTVHDNCYSKAIKDSYWEDPREILKKCGCSIVEMKHNRQDSLCCGFGAGASWVKNLSIPFDIISEGAKKFKEAGETGAQALVSYCTGCIYLLWASKELLRSKIDVYHHIELIRLAMGEHLRYPEDNIKRAWDIIAIISYSLLMSSFKKNFYISRITYDKNRSTFKPHRYYLLQLMRKMFDIIIIRRIYSKLFRMLMPIMKSK